MAILCLIFLISHDGSNPRSFCKAASRNWSSEGTPIAIVQEEPFLFPNGTGFFPELLALMKLNRKPFLQPDMKLEIEPLFSWTLMRHLSKDIAFGLVAPSLAKNTKYPFNFSVLRTSLRILSQVARKTTFQVGRARIIVVKDSPVHHLLSVKFSSILRTVDTLDQATFILQADSKSIVILDSMVAEYLQRAMKHVADIKVTSHPVLDQQSKLNYGFFGTNKNKLENMNRLLENIENSPALMELSRKYFVSTE